MGACSEIVDGVVKLGPRTFTRRLPTRQDVVTPDLGKAFQHHEGSLAHKTETNIADCSQKLKHREEEQVGIGV